MNDAAGRAPLLSVSPARRWPVPEGWQNRVEPFQGSKWQVGFVTQGARRGAATLGYGVQRRWRWQRHGPWYPECVRRAGTTVGSPR